jgi:hypothetical protein
VAVRGDSDGVKELEGHLFIDQRGHLALGQRSEDPTRYVDAIPLSLPISEFSPVRAEVKFKFEPISEVSDAAK